MSEFKPIYLPANSFKYRKTKSLGTIQTQAGQGNEGLDLAAWINQGIADGFITSASGGGNLSVGTLNATTLPLNIDSGTDATLPSATTSFAGIMTAADKSKLDGLTNYVHPNHSGDVTSTGDGATTITDKAVTNNKLADMPGYTVKVRSASNTGIPTNLVLSNNTILGRGTGNITGLTLGTGFSIDTNVLNFAGSGSSYAGYSLPITSGNSGSALQMFSDSNLISANWVSGTNTLEVNIPLGKSLLYLDWRLVTADIQAAADASGATNWVLVKFNGTNANTSITNLKIPNIQKTNIPTSGVLSLTNAASIDIDNNPLTSIVDVGSNSITLRIQGLSVGSQGYHLKFSNIS